MTALEPQAGTSPDAEALRALARADAHDTLSQEAREIRDLRLTSRLILALLWVLALVSSASIVGSEAVLPLAARVATVLGVGVEIWAARALHGVRWAKLVWEEG